MALKFNTTTGVPEDFVYTFENVLFKVISSGNSYAVSAVSATAQECGIPTIVLTINPKPNPNAASIEVPTLSDFMAWHGELQALAATKRKKVSFYLKAICSNEVQEIDIKEWVLTQAGMLEVGAGGSFSTQVVIQHPIYGAGSGLLAFFDHYKLGAMGSRLPRRDNIVNLIVDAIALSLKQRNPDNSVEVPMESVTKEVTIKTIKEIDKAVYAKAVQSHAILKKWLQWDPAYTRGTIPFAFADDTIAEDYYAYGGINTGAYLEDKGSPYSVFMAMATQMMLMTYGTFSDDPIKVRPSEPWAENDTYVRQVEISSVAMPTGSLLRINGVLATGISAQSDIYQNAGDKTGDTQLKHEDTKVGGAYVDKWTAIEGATKVIGTPDFLGTYLGGKDSSNGFSNEDFQNNELSESTGASDPNAAAAAAKLDAVRIAILNAYCHDEFWRTFGSDVTLGLVTRLLITEASDSGKLSLRPGNILRMLGDNDTLLYTCYITTVQHVISVEEGRAYTSIQGTYARGPEGIPGVYSPFSPVYSKVYGEYTGSAASVAAAIPPVARVWV